MPDMVANDPENVETQTRCRHLSPVKSRIDLTFYLIPNGGFLDVFPEWRLLNTGSGIRRPCW